MSSKLPNVGSSANSDEQSFAEYIGTGEAHYVPPAMKKQKFMDPMEPEPKSIDVFANSEPGSQESSQESANDYETCPEGGMETSLEEGAGLEEEEEAEPTPRRRMEELGSKTIRFEPKIKNNSPFLTHTAQKSMEKRRQLDMLTKGYSAQNSPNSPFLAQNEPKNTPKSVEQSPSAKKNLYPIFMAQNSPKSVKNEQNSTQKTPISAQKSPFLAQKTPNSAHKHPYLPQKTPNLAHRSPFLPQKTPISAQKSPFSPQTAPLSIKTPGSTASDRPYFTPRESAKTPQKAGRSIEQAGKTLRRSLFDENPAPKIAYSPQRDSDGSEDSEEDRSMEERKKSRRSMVDKPPPFNFSEDEDNEVLHKMESPISLSDDDDDEVVRGMEEDREAESRNQHRVKGPSPGTVTYGPLSGSPKGPQVKKEQTPYQYTHHPVDEALEEEEDDDDNQYFQPVPKKSMPTLEPVVKEPEEEELEDEEVDPELMEVDDSQPRAQAGIESQESPEKRPDSRKRARVDSSSEQKPVSSPDPQEELEHRIFRRQFVKNEAEFSENNLIFRPDLENDNQHHNMIYCKIRGLPDRDNAQRPTDGQYSSILNQVWSQTDHRDDPNAYYQYQKALLTNWLNDYRSNGSCYQLFVGLIHDMMGLPHTTLLALDRYYYRKRRETSDKVAMEQFANVVRLALQAEDILPGHIYLLTGDVRSATFSHKQCAALVARMFFNQRKLKFGGPVNLNFLDILVGRELWFVEKLYFLFAYTDKMYTSPPEGVVSFRRCFTLNETRGEIFKTRFPEPLPAVEFLDTMNIEETAMCTQVDFANMRIGGGVLGHGFVQEEIRFLMCPEMLVSMMLLPREMKSNEAFSIVGAYVFSSYDGYGQYTKWRELKRKHARQNDDAHRDRFGRLEIETIAIDALHYDTGRGRGYSLIEQLDWANIRRETFKAWQGFSSQTFRFKNIPVVSGWWGCGAFGGNKAVKFIIQVIAAGIANRPLHICTFRETVTGEKCRNFLRFLNERQITTGKLLQLLRYVPEPRYYTEFYVFDKIVGMIQMEERGLVGAFL